MGLDFLQGSIGVPKELTELAMGRSTETLSDVGRHGDRGFVDLGYETKPLT